MYTYIYIGIYIRSASLKLVARHQVIDFRNREIAQFKPLGRRRLLGALDFGALFQLKVKALAVVSENVQAFNDATCTSRVSFLVPTVRAFAGGGPASSDPL